MPGRSGSIRWALPTTDSNATARLSGADTMQVLGPRAHASHKGSHGDLAVVGGAAGMTGAALLAARAALASGAGRVFVSLLDAGGPPCDLQHPELMFRPQWWRSEPATLARCTVVCGCGGGTAVREVLPVLLSRCPRLLLDADALNALAADEGLRRQLRDRCRTRPGDAADAAPAGGRPPAGQRRGRRAGRPAAGRRHAGAEARAAWCCSRARAA